MVRQFGLRCGASKFTSVLETVKKVIRNKGTILPNPQDTVLDLLYGRGRSQTLYAGVNLGIFESIGHAPIHAADVARKLGLDSALSYRLLRALGSLGLLREHEGQCFVITEAGELLQSEHPQSMRDMILLREGPQHTSIWKHLSAIVRDGKQNGFVREYGATAFEHATHRPPYGNCFDDGMSSYSRLQTAWTIGQSRPYAVATSLRIRIYVTLVAGKVIFCASCWFKIRTSWAPCWNDPV